MDGYRYVYTQEVAFRDLDAFGHVNNGVYLTYIENARIGYARDVIGIESLEGLLMVADLAQPVYTLSAYGREGDSC